MRRGLPVAAIVLTGDELLDGRTRDTNGAFLAARLAYKIIAYTQRRSAA